MSWIRRLPDGSIRLERGRSRRPGMEQALVRGPVVLQPGDPEHTYWDNWLREVLERDDAQKKKPR